MLKPALVAACALLLNGCPFLPPDPYRTTFLGQLPPGYIAMHPGEHLTDSANHDLPAFADMIGASSELEGEVLAATFHLRELPEKPQFILEGRGGHFRDDQYRYAVLVRIDGDPLTPLTHCDYRFQITYYDPEVVRFRDGKQIPNQPYITTRLLECGRYTRTHNGETSEYPSYSQIEGDVESTFSHEDGTLTLRARIPGITEQSTIALFSHNFWMVSPDYLPRSDND